MNKITFIAPSFNEESFNRPLVDSLICQTNPNWKVIIYNNGQNSNLKEWAKNYNDSRIIYLESENNTGYWGTYNRIDALQNSVDTKYVIQTSVQDYFLSWAVELILNRLKETNADICMWDSINHLAGYEPLIVSLKQNYIDWGNFCLKTSIAKKLSISKPEEYCADWLTLEKGLQLNLFKVKTKIANILTIHN